MEAFDTVFDRSSVGGDGGKHLGLNILVVALHHPNSVGFRYYPKGPDKRLDHGVDSVPIPGHRCLGHACGEIENEHVVKVVIDDSGCALDFARITDDKSAMRHIGLYVYKPAFLQTYVAMQPTQNEIARRLEQMRVLDNGYEIAVACVATQPGGIDTEEQYDAFVKRVG